MKIIRNKVAEQKIIQNERISFLADIEYSKVNNYIDNLFSNLNTAQRTYLKKLTKLVLYLIKRN